MDAASHRVWRYAPVAWVVLIAAPIIPAVIRWEMGVDRDIDMSGVHELIFTFLIVLSVPMAALAFGVFAPLAVAIDRLTRGRTSRLVNVLLGATLAAPALLVILMVAGWPRRGSASHAMVLVAALLLAGMIVGLGLRHHGTLPSVRRPSLC